MNEFSIMDTVDMSKNRELCLSYSRALSYNKNRKHLEVLLDGRLYVKLAKTQGGKQ